MIISKIETIRVDEFPDLIFVQIHICYDIVRDIEEIQGKTLLRSEPKL